MPSYSKPLVWTMTCSVWPVHFLTGAMPIDGSRGSCWMGTVTVVPGGGWLRLANRGQVLWRHDLPLGDVGQSRRRARSDGSPSACS